MRAEDEDETRDGGAVGAWSLATAVGARFHAAAEVREGLVGARGIAPSCLTLARWSDLCVRTSLGSRLTRLDGSATGVETSRWHGPTDGPARVRSFGESGAPGAEPGAGEVG